MGLPLNRLIRQKPKATTTIKPKLRVMSLLETGMMSHYRIEGVLRKYAPDTVEFVKENPDLLLVHSHKGDGLMFNTALDDPRTIRYSNADKWYRLLSLFLSKPKLILFEWCDTPRFPAWVGKNDLIHALDPRTPSHPNRLIDDPQLAGRWIDEEIFYRENREVKHKVGIMKDHAEFQDFLVNHTSVHFLGANERQHVSGISDDVYHRHKDRIAMTRVPQHDTDRIRAVLNSVEMVMCLQDIVGFESTGIEGMFCGSQPIYWGNDFYERMHAGLNVKFVDPFHPQESLRDLIAQGNTLTDADIQAGVQRWGAKERVPKLWRAVLKAMI